MEQKKPDDWNHWKFGLFYYNPNNSDLLVEKRSGMGLTFNFAHRKAYYLLLFLILFPVLAIILPLYLLG